MLACDFPALKCLSKAKNAARCRHRNTPQHSDTGLRSVTTVNSQRHLRRLGKLIPLYPQALIGETLRLAQRCNFGLDELRYEYPEEVDAGPRQMVIYVTTYRRSVQALAESFHYSRRMSANSPSLPSLIRVLLSNGMQHCQFRARDILCQGRGSAANSVICYCLHITGLT